MQETAIYNESKKLEIVCAEYSLPSRSNQSIFVIKTPSNTFRHFVDCDYELLDDKKFVSLESFLEDGKRKIYRVERFSNIVVSGNELLVKNQSFVLDPFENQHKKLEEGGDSGYYGILFQREINLQNDKEVFLDEIQLLKNARVEA